MREKILETLITALEPKDFVLAFWQGGSAAHGYTDEWSDLDIEVIVKDDEVQQTFDAVEEALQTISEISFNYRVPEPTWHGHSQTFYQLAEANPFLVIDFAVMKQSSRNDFLEVERHGNAVIAFDKANLVVPQNVNQSEHFSQMKERFTHQKKLFNFLQVFVKKEINRGHLAQAIVNYQSYTLRNLVELLGMLYRPYRYDFTIKYFNRDFPSEVVARVEPLFCITDLADLANKQQLAEEMFAETLSRVEQMLEKHK
ncbi:nucleotidyltransferase domain-containing protein [Hassallia byssoidea VB512170]|uniref:Nucleotidyltransferase domain-containing protein n=1 Tax=Hassallia byssoidea VB512170 TaxID=1304833 RepID=A0A846HEY7_9CYAN|nr:aminoglycoside 6-adenylyltransferase [Hassalia byssoidea]NEU75876.1 nucleotidyltransferase domain-containing protein [Hassalia byssoidea VB512170]